MMKKFFLGLCLLIVSVAADAQFERGKVVLNTSLSGFDMSYNKQTKGHLGLDVMGGYFILDNFALTGTLGMDLSDAVNQYHFGVGARYYLEDNGLYFGGMVKDTSYSYKKASNDNDFALQAEDVRGESHTGE